LRDYDVLHDGDASLMISEQTPEDLLPYTIFSTNSKHRSHDTKVVYIDILLKSTINSLYNELIDAMWDRKNTIIIQIIISHI